MSATVQGNLARGLASLRRLASRPPEPERCELCASTLAEEHPHLVDPANRRLLCACQACSILFDESGVTRYRRVPRDSRALAGMEIGDAFWNGLAIPIGLVFFFRSTASGSVIALYPSPAGPTETSVDEETWQELAALHPALAAMRPDVEALLANRIRDTREYFIVPVDECYKLTGLIRRHWRGFNGGDEAWKQIDGFFENLKRRAIPERMGKGA
jgi:hypothetical protein